jgi:hypothetical protein
MPTHHAWPPRLDAFETFCHAAGAGLGKGAIPMRGDAPRLPLVLAALVGGLALFVAGVACEKEVEDATEPGSREWCDNRASAARKMGDDCQMWRGRFTGVEYSRVAAPGTGVRSATIKGSKSLTRAKRSRTCGSQ